MGGIFYMAVKQAQVPTPKVPGGELRDWVQCILSAIVACVLVFVFVGRLVDVVGSSMYPTLENGEMVIISRLFFQPKYGDIVVLQQKSYDEECIIKRVIATEGQTVDIDFSTGDVRVDGEVLEEDYINERTYLEEGTEFPLTVPKGSIFVMGDNRNHSSDSRDSRLGTVDARYVIGKAVFLAFPGPDMDTKERDWSRIGLLD